MATLDVTVTVSKETYELGQAVGQLVEATKVALADGWDTSQDLPVLMLEALRVLPPAVQGVDQLDDEMKANPSAFAKAIALGVADAVEAALKKAPVA